MLVNSNGENSALSPLDTQSKSLSSSLELRLVRGLFQQCLSAAEVVKLYSFCLDF